MSHIFISVALSTLSLSYIRPLGEGIRRAMKGLDSFLKAEAKLRRELRANRSSKGGGRDGYSGIQWTRTHCCPV